MKAQTQSRQRLLASGAALALAVGLGFGIAKVTTPSTPAVTPASGTAAPSGPQTITVPADHLQAVGIATEALREGAISGEIIAPASVVSAPSAEASLVARSSGAIIRVLKQIGDPVRAGETVALIESREAAAAAADRRVANARLALARQTTARERSLVEQRVSARQDYDRAQAEMLAAEAEAERAQAAATAVHVSTDGRSAAVVSPIAGKVTAQSAVLGAYVEPQTELYRIADARFVSVQAQVSPVDAARISVGDPAVIVRQDGGTVNATIASVTPTASGASRTTTVLVKPVSSSGLVAGIGVQVRLVARTAGAASAVLAPDEAVQSVDGKDVVFVRTNTGFVVQPVDVFKRSGGVASITSGVRPGQIIATRNAFLLKAELQKPGEE